jgi:hypothetical protein
MSIMAKDHIVILFPEKIMRSTVRKQYLCVTLCLHGKHINTIVHR